MAFPLAPTPELSLGLWAMNFFCAMIGVGPANAAVQMITPNQMRGQIRAAYQFVFNVVGFGAGPFLVAVCTDYVFGYDGALRYLAGDGGCDHRTSGRAAHLVWHEAVRRVRRPVAHLDLKQENSCHRPIPHRRRSNSP